MAGDAFRFASFADQEQLGQYGNRFQVDGEGPQDFQWGKRVVNQQGQQEAGNEQKLDAERVVVVVVRCFKLDIHQINCGHGGTDEDQLHEGIVHADERRHQVQIATNVNDGEEDLRFARYASA